MMALRILAWTAALGAGGWWLGQTWQQVIIRSLSDAGAQVVISSPGALTGDLITFALLTGAMAPVAAGVRWLIHTRLRQPPRPLWQLILALLVGENLGVSLRLVALATINLPQAASIAAVNGGPVMIRVEDTALAIWALAGLLGAMVVLLGMMIVTGILNDTPDA